MKTFTEFLNESVSKDDAESIVNKYNLDKQFKKELIAYAKKLMKTGGLHSKAKVKDSVYSELKYGDSEWDLKGDYKKAADEIIDWFSNFEGLK